MVAAIALGGRSNGSFRYQGDQEVFKIVVGVAVTVGIIYIIFEICCMYVVVKCYQYLSHEQQRAQPALAYQGYPSGNPGGVVIMQAPPQQQSHTNLGQTYEPQHGKY